MGRYTLEQQSMVINALRFPMTVFVVGIHFNILLYPLVSHGVIIQYDWSWVQYPITLFSEVLGRLAVPFFFLISGYFFFFKEESFTKKVYFDKIKKRFQTLFIPYVTWWAVAGILMFILSRYNLCVSLSIKNILSGLWCIKTKGIVLTTSPCLPLDEPLWFLRDLMIMMLLSPVVYQIIKHGRNSVLFLLLLSNIYVLLGWFDVPQYILPGLSFPCILFFSIGAYMGWEKINLLDQSYRWRWILIPASVILLFVDTILTHYISPLTWSAHYTQNGFIHNLYILCGLPLVFLMGGKLCNYMNSLLKFASSSFFIFALHKIIIIPMGYVVVYFSHIGNVISPICALAFYGGIIFLSVVVCLLAYYFVSRSMLMQKFLIGGR